MLKVILGLIVAAIAIVLVIASRKPDTFSVQRSIVIAAPPAKVFEAINSFKRWRDWSAYETKDPALLRSYSGPESGVGAAYAWQGNSDVGQGRMQILEATAPSRIHIRLSFVKPMAAENEAIFTIEPAAEGSRVVWTMNGAAPFIHKIFSTVLDMDHLIGRDFEAGLANLKRISEH